jgi:predicted AlkP superfamily phosphohydrolase/phosphomutase
LTTFPLGDAIDHTLMGFLEPTSPHHDPRAEGLRTAAWRLVDLRVAHLRDLAGGVPSGAFFLTGDHGMRATWRWFAPNAALRDAGLLAIDDNGDIDLSRTRALSPNGYWVAVNRTAWQGGIVPPEEEAAVISAAVEALRAARDEAGEPIVTEIFLPEGDPELGLGGPAAGDVYYETAAGYRWSWRADTPVSSPADVGAGHGFPSTSPDMYTAFCAVGVGTGPRRIGEVHSVTVAPTVAEWIGMGPPADAVGESVLPRMRD